ncbi:conserved hypothetical protein [Halorhabdus utahensis DSM 12940]|uniref:Uncharacterized protein n=1 Tax=Halorhabdus utahensis (strain DSM 12940 / JCM 11049 / AX-2) TaxID=519442 RepID=C7NU90_HALUD|nr:ATP-binding protein [Halorhabdus utahensis]ACV10987.1 conserved hypothetical protein [Halorhabdus utahensis DSM 12940]
MSDDNTELYTAAQTREYLEGHGVRDPKAGPQAGIIRDPHISRTAAIAREDYDPNLLDEPGEMPADLLDADPWQDIVAVEETETIREAMDAGDMPSLKHITGDAGQRADVSGLEAIGDLRDHVTGDAVIIYLWAPPGRGKTDFALLLSQLYEEAHPGAETGSNIRTWTEKDEWIPTYPDLMDWMEADEEAVLAGDVEDKLFIFDEASSHASGRGEDGYEAGQKLGPLVYKIRKYGGSIIIIGHDGKDVHPVVREMATCIKKTSKKSANVFETVNNRRGMNKLLEIDGIPATDHTFNTNEPTAWRWDGTGEDDGVPEPGSVAYDVALWTVVKCKQDGLTHRETAQYVPYSKSWVGDRWGEWEAGEHRDAVDKVEELTE